MCRGNPAASRRARAGPVDVSDACAVLAAWDLHDNLDSRGAILFRRFCDRALGRAGARRRLDDPFDAGRPGQHAERR